MQLSKQRCLPDILRCAFQRGYRRNGKKRGTVGCCLHNTGVGTSPVFIHLHPMACFPDDSTFTHCPAPPSEGPRGPPLSPFAPQGDDTLQKEHPTFLLSGWSPFVTYSPFKTLSPFCFSQVDRLRSSGTMHLELVTTVFCKLGTNGHWTVLFCLWYDSHSFQR